MIKKTFVVILGVTLFALVGCGQEEPKSSADKATEAMHDAAEATKEAAHDAGNAIKEAAHDAGNAVKEAAHDAEK